MGLSLALPPLPPPPEQGLLFRRSGISEVAVPVSGLVTHVRVSNDPIPAEQHAFVYRSLGKLHWIPDYALLHECAGVLHTRLDYPDERVSQISR